MKVRTKEQRATLRHPVHPEVYAVVRRLTDVQKLEQRAALREIQKRVDVIAVRDQDGTLIRDENGILETRDIPPVAELIEHALKVSLVDHGGLTDEDDRPIPFADNFDEVFALMWGDELAFEEEVPGIDHGPCGPGTVEGHDGMGHWKSPNWPQSPPEKRRTSWAMHVARSAGKKETFDPDPLAASSPTAPPALSTSEPSTAASA